MQHLRCLVLMTKDLMSHRSQKSPTTTHKRNATALCENLSQQIWDKTMKCLEAFSGSSCSCCRKTTVASQGLQDIERARTTLGTWRNSRTTFCHYFRAIETKHNKTRQTQIKLGNICLHPIITTYFRSKSHNQFYGLIIKISSFPYVFLCLNIEKLFFDI